jgi:hypothetical protein
MFFRQVSPNDVRVLIGFAHARLLTCQCEDELWPTDDAYFSICLEEKLKQERWALFPYNPIFTTMK